MASEDYDPNQTLPLLTFALGLPAMRIAAWASKDPPLPPIALTPGLADRSGALLDVLAKYTGEEHIPRLRAAIAEGDRSALEALQHAVNDTRDLISAFIPTLVENSIKWFGRGQYQAVANLCPDFAALAWIVGDDFTAAELYVLAARSFWKADDANSTAAMYELAIPLCERAIPVAERRQRADVLVRLAAWHDNLGLALTALERFDEAIVHYQSSMDFEPDPLRRLTIRNNLAFTYREMGQYAIAAREHEKVWEELSSGTAGEADATQLALALDNWAVALMDDGDVAKALPLLERAAPLFPRDALDARRRNASNRFSAYELAGRYDEAAEGFRETWELALEHTARQADVDHFRDGFRTALARLLPPTSESWRYFARAAQAFSAQQWEVAAGNYAEAAGIAYEAADQLMYLRCRAAVAGAKADAQQVDEALQECRVVQREAMRVGLALPMALSAVTMASLMRGGSDQGGPLGALAFSAAGLAYAALHDLLVDEANLPPDDIGFWRVDVGVAQAQVAEAAENAHAYDLAESYYRDAISFARRIGYRFGELNRNVGLLGVLDELPERRADGDTLAHELRVELERADTPPVMRLVILRCLGVRGTDTPQSLADLKAAAALLEELRAERPPGAARSDLDREYRVYPLLLRRLQESNATAAEEFQILQAMRARRLMETLTVAAGDSAPYQPIGVGELQELLARQPRLTTFVDVTVTETGLRAYLVDRAGLRTIDVVGDVAPLRAVQWGDIGRRAAEVVALVAGSSILADLASAVTGQLEDGSTMLLAVDDELANMPMHAIPVGDTPWADNVSIGRIPAAGILRFTPPDRSWSGHAVVAGDSNNDLAGAQRECVAVAANLGAEPIIGDACTFDAIREGLTAAPEKRLDVVHLAVHGRADARRAGRSSLLFAGDPRQWVAFAELAALPWNANLIVLSGCSTAVGGPRNGVGLYGVAQAAAEAGATTVIASLWPVDDISAEEFMTAFYSELSRRRGSGLIDLRELMDHARTHLRQTAPLGGRSVRRDGRELIIDEPGRESWPVADAQQAAMMHWAPFVLIGEPTLIV